jgi:hypothetical protein
MPEMDGSVLGMLVATLEGDEEALAQLLDAMRDAGHEQAAGKLENLLRLSEDLAGCLWPGGDPDRQWGPDTLEEVADLLNTAGLRPAGSDNSGCDRCGTNDAVGSDGSCQDCGEAGKDA